MLYGTYVVNEETLPSQIIEKLGESVNAWETQRTEELAALINKIVDLGVSHEMLLAQPDVSIAIIVPGIGAHVNDESEFGRMLIALKVAFENRNFEEFRNAVVHLHAYFEALAQIGQHQDMGQYGLEYQEKSEKEEEVKDGQSEKQTDFIDWHDLGSELDAWKSELENQKDNEITIIDWDAPGGWDDPSPEGVEGEGGTEGQKENGGGEE